jgi:hypothetical protein
VNPAGGEDVVVVAVVDDVAGVVVGTVVVDVVVATDAGELEQAASVKADSATAPAAAALRARLITLRTLRTPSANVIPPSRQCSCSKRRSNLATWRRP